QLCPRQSLGHGLQLHSRLQPEPRDERESRIWSVGRRPETQGVPFNPSALGLPSFLDNFGGPGAFPGISIQGFFPLGGGGAVLNSTPREARTYAVDFTKVRGAHNMNVGFMAIDFYLNTFNSSAASFNFPLNLTQGPDPRAPNSQTGSGFASFALDRKSVV